MRTGLIILLFIIFFSGISLSKERKLWIGYSFGESKSRSDGFVWIVEGENKGEATKVFLRDRKKLEGVYKFKVLNASGLTTDYDIWEITDSIIHKK